MKNAAFDSNAFEEMVEQGLSDRKIASELGVGKMTVKNQFLICVY